MRLPNCNRRYSRMIRTVQELIGVDTGFRADHVLTTRFALSGTQWTEERRQAFYPEFLQRIRAIPGVTNAAFTMCRSMMIGETPLS